MDYEKKTKKTEILNGRMPGIRPRHIEAIKSIGKHRTEAEALEQLSYSKSYAKSGLIKRTQSWKTISEEMLPNDLLAKVNLGLLKHSNWQARNQGLDKAYKAKRIYTNGTEINIDTRPKEEIIESILRRIKGSR